VSDDAGEFSPWLTSIRASIRGEHGSEVPCGGCTACCKASQFIPIGPDETDTLAHIPPALLFPAPRRPGHVVLGYDERGHCPMLIDERCSIYEHRPRTCRTYDCRIFPATGIGAGDDGVARRARRWQFRFPTAADREEHAAVRAAAAFLEQHEWSAGILPTNATQRAVLAIEVHDNFLRADSDPDVVRAEVIRRTA
jgi:Fe-S-cluster containining protein